MMSMMNTETVKNGVVGWTEEESDYLMFFLDDEQMMIARQAYEFAAKRNQGLDRHAVACMLQHEANEGIRVGDLVITAGGNGKAFYCGNGQVEFINYAKDNDGEYTVPVASKMATVEQIGRAKLIASWIVENVSKY